MEGAVFGTFFEHGEDIYIYLGYDQPHDILHVAKILEVDDSKHLESMFTSKSKNKDFDPKSLLWCYTTLTSQDFEGRVAQFGNSGNYGVEVTGVLGDINEDDRKELRKDILAAYVSEDLKDIVRKTTPDD